MASHSPDEPVNIDITITAKLAWWVRPYLELTRFGVWLGLPLNPEVVASDLRRGVKVKTKCSIRAEK